MQAMQQRVDGFVARTDDGREFRILVWQEFEPQRAGAVHTRMVPSIQLMETQEGYYVRPTPDGRYAVPELGIVVARVNEPAARS